MKKLVVLFFSLIISSCVVYYPLLSFDVKTEIISDKHFTESTLNVVETLYKVTLISDEISSISELPGYKMDYEWSDVNQSNCSIIQLSGTQRLDKDNLGINIYNFGSNGSFNHGSPESSNIQYFSVRTQANSSINSTSEIRIYAKAQVISTSYSTPVGVVRDSFNYYIPYVLVQQYP